MLFYLFVFWSFYFIASNNNYNLKLAKNISLVYITQKQFAAAATTKNAHKQTKNANKQYAAWIYINRIKVEQSMVCWKKNKHEQPKLSLHNNSCVCLFANIVCLKVYFCVGHKCSLCVSVFFFVFLIYYLFTMIAEFCVCVWVF